MTRPFGQKSEICHGLYLTRPVWNDIPFRFSDPCRDGPKEPKLSTAVAEAFGTKATALAGFYGHKSLERFDFRSNDYTWQAYSG